MAKNVDTPALDGKSTVGRRRHRIEKVAGRKLAIKLVQQLVLTLPEDADTPVEMLGRLLAAAAMLADGPALVAGYCCGYSPGPGTLPSAAKTQLLGMLGESACHHLGTAHHALVDKGVEGWACAWVMRCSKPFVFCPHSRCQLAGHIMPATIPAGRAIGLSCNGTDHIITPPCATWGRPLVAAVAHAATPPRLPPTARPDCPAATLLLLF